MSSDAVDALGRLIPSLLVLLAALFAVRWWARRQGGGASREIRVLSRTGLSRGAVLAIVQVGERRLLLGVTDHAVNLVTELSAAPAELDVTDARQLAAQQSSAAMDAAAHAQTAAMGAAAQHGSAATDAAELASALGATVGPRMGLVDRLREMTVRGAPPRPPRVRS